MRGQAAIRIRLIVSDEDEVGRDPDRDRNQCREPHPQGTSVTVHKARVRALAPRTGLESSDRYELEAAWLSRAG